VPPLNRIAAFAEDMTAWRRYLHRRPELGFDCVETAAFVAARLRDFGVDEIHQGIARTGLIAVIRGQRPGPAVGLRADMDALPMDERSGVPHASELPGRMHACGHDGHTAMLLGAARYLAETRAFAGRAVLIFQPAEEWGGGAQVMLAEGLLDRFALREIYALHTAPGIPLGAVATAPGPIMAAVDDFHLTLTGQGGHAARPHLARDPIPAAAALVQALQTLVSREADPLGALVVTVTQINAGSAINVIPEAATLAGTVRSYAPELQARILERIGEVAEGIASAFGLAADLRIERGYPATVNDPGRAAFAAAVAREIAPAVTEDMTPEMGSEDFSFLLQRCPGAYLLLGNGDTAGVHHPLFDFDDRAAPVGASLLARLVERALPLED
jgi:hippurate hydrolase